MKAEFEECPIDTFYRTCMSIGLHLVGFSYSHGEIITMIQDDGYDGF